MKRTGLVASAAIVALLAAACGGRDDSSSSATTASAATTGGRRHDGGGAHDGRRATEATDVGITATEIHIGVVADVDTPISPGLSQPLVSAVKAWGDQVNANGGLAGRKVVVTFYDSKLNPDEAVNAYTQACQNEFATVGSGAFVLLNPDPIQTCKDKSGNAIGLPDVAAPRRSARQRRRRSRRTRSSSRAKTSPQPSRRSPSRSTAGATTSASSAALQLGEPDRHRSRGAGHRPGHPRRRAGAHRAGRQLRPARSSTRRSAADRGDADHPEDKHRGDQLGGKHVDRGREADGRGRVSRAST